MNLDLLGLVALVPLTLGTSPQGDEGRTLAVQLCSGGAIEIPIDEDRSDLPVPCHAQACHSGSCRKRV